ncbi:MAG: TlpA disulfide reductase family protein [Pseudomonadota bacterium]
MAQGSSKWMGHLRAVLRGVGLAGIIALFVLAILNSGSGLTKGTPAPPVVGQGLDGQRVALSGFKGRPAVVNFWATWCPPCLAELPELEKAHRLLGDRVDFYGLAVESGTPAQVSDMVKRFGLTYAVVLPFHEVQQAYRVNSFPTTFIVAPDGTIARTYSSTVDLELLQRDLQPWLGTPGS